MSEVVQFRGKERSSGVEFYRIIAMILICMSHAAQTFFYKYSIPDTLLNGIFLFFRDCLGQTGNLIFIICSSYFLIDSNNVKGNKVIKILLDSAIISVLVYFGFLIGGYKFSFMESISHFLPDFFSNMWFIPIYVLFYMIHPMLNAAINGVSRKTHLTFCVIVFVFYGFGGLLFGWSLGMDPLVRFAAVYILVAYFKRYHGEVCESRKINKAVFTISAFLFVFLAAVKYFFNLRIIILSQFYSPILFPLIFSGFNLLRTKKFYNKPVNYLASCSLYFYCIHENLLIRQYLRADFYDYFMSKKLNFAGGGYRIYPALFCDLACLRIPTVFAV